MNDVAIPIPSAMAEENDNIIKRTVSSVAELAGRASGKELADQVDSFTETFGEILVGLHHEVERQKREAEDASRRDFELTQRLDALEESIQMLGNAGDIGKRLTQATDNLVHLQTEVKEARRRQTWMVIAVLFIAAVSILAALLL
jgi:hypothetical protein